MPSAVRWTESKASASESLMRRRGWRRWPIRRLAQRPRRRRFTAEYKLAIVREADACMHQAGRGRCAAAPVSALLEELLSKGATQTDEQQPPR